MNSLSQEKLNDKDFVSHVVTSELSNDDEKLGGVRVLTKPVPLRVRFDEKKLIAVFEQEKRICCSEGNFNFFLFL